MPPPHQPGWCCHRLADDGTLLEQLLKPRQAMHTFFFVQTADTLTIRLAAPSTLTFFFYFIIIITIVVISAIISVFIIVVIAWDRFPVLLRLRLRVPMNSYCDYLVVLLLSVRGNPYPRLLLLEPAYPL